MNMHTPAHKQSPEKMTRSDYLHTGGGFAAHRAYYAQMVTPALADLVVYIIGAQRIRDSKDDHMNDIALIRWDRCACEIRPLVEPKLRELGDCWSMAGGVCIAKEAARQIKEGL